MKNDILHLRKATSLDIDILFEWVNDKDTRQNAFDSHMITYAEHSVWFHRMINDSNQAQYILMSREHPIGQIRFTIEETVAEIHYSISPSARRCGYGGKIIELAIKQVKEDYPFIKRIIGKVKPSNVASYCCFTKNGFKEKYRQLEYDFSHDIE